MAINTDYKINTEEIKSFISNWFHGTYGDHTYGNQINQINTFCIQLSELGYNLLETTNLVTIQQHRLIMNEQMIMPYHTGFQHEFTGKPLIQSILEDKNLVQNHVFYSIPQYLSIREIMNNLNN
tara:strand:+ start:1735 stop:2106 length:372 start_codon:yes stop_codon:yes gene_type:complete